ncbi:MULTISPECIES: hypothetical protein [unclassified Janthinobacterium]|uniref:hypothetical protein n=1 Tax=unclassified Janthinobacterium TaxID=2610881 RepID=UPI0017B6C7C7|nr:MULTISPECIES: hypothetical protein [unclassified Janthinobacterium]MBB5371088.1 hypothetical protein [Janthinobacterium sp. K2C7]MBB5383894.1 hypothetical protein [Janthinobacterium sp. K2Li3]MBB5389284.1 hypothetical protein [Janthinobacterium sp. K2E3]
MQVIDQMLKGRVEQLCGQYQTAIKQQERRRWGHGRHDDNCHGGKTLQAKTLSNGRLRRVHAGSIPCVLPKAAVFIRWQILALAVSLAWR